MAYDSYSERRLDHAMRIAQAIDIILAGNAIGPDCHPGRHGKILDRCDLVSILAGSHSRVESTFGGLQTWLLSVVGSGKSICTAIALIAE